MNEKELSNEELIRYSRHLMLPDVGKEGQKKIKQAKVLIIGAGGLGSPAAIYLAAAGVGTIGIVDFDEVETSNLQRQILYTIDDIGSLKTTITKNQLKKINPNTNIITHDEKLTSKNAIEIIKNYDIVIDGSDNFPTRYLVNDACVLLNKPNIYGSIFRFDGQATVFNARKSEISGTTSGGYKNGPCYRCMFPNPPPAELVPSCADAGVLGVLPGVIGTIQATEALKIILEIGNILSGRFLVYNALSMSFKELNLRKNKNCIVCGENPKIKELIDYEQFCGLKKKENNQEITVTQLKTMKENNEDFELIDVREEIEQEICKIGGAKLTSYIDIVRGNTNPFESININKKIVLYCHTGERSAFILNLLKEKGYKNLKNLIGGIDAWAKEIDKEIVVY